MEVLKWWLFSVESFSNHIFFTQPQSPKLEQSTQITTATHPSLFWIFILILNWNSLPVKYILSVPDKNRENSTLECYKIQPTRYGKCQPSQIFVLLYECLRGERDINNSIWSASCQWGIIILIIIIITSPSLSWSSSSSSSSPQSSLSWYHYHYHDCIIIIGNFILAAKLKFPIMMMQSW